LKVGCVQVKAEVDVCDFDGDAEVDIGVRIDEAVFITAPYT
jgi:hypothetical protein